MSATVKGTGNCMSRDTPRGEIILLATNGDQSALEVADDRSVKRNRTSQPDGLFRINQTRSRSPVVVKTSSTDDHRRVAVISPVRPPRKEDEKGRHRKKRMQSSRAEEDALKEESSKL